MKTQNKTQIAVAYARFSSDNQRDESIDAQLRAIREYADSRKITIIHEYIDRAKSATSDDRPAFQEMIRDSASHKFNIVIIHKLDRFARNRFDSTFYKRELHRNGVTIQSVLENIDDSPESIIMESVLEGMAEYYSKNLAREVRKGMKETALKCQHTGGLPPLGYDVDPNTKKLVINESESRAVKIIFTMFLEGNGYVKIIKELNNRGIKTKRGGLFAKNVIYGILKNRKYTGVYIFNRATSKDIDGKRNNHTSKSSDEIICIKDGVPRIISDNDFEKVQERLNSRKRLDTTKAKEKYLLTGKIICGECEHSFCGNRKFSGRNKRLHITYRCNNRTGRDCIACDNKEINRDRIEQYTLKILSDIIFDENSMEQIVKNYNDFIQKSSSESENAIQDISKKIADNNRRIDNITNTIAETGNATLVTALENLEIERDRLHAQLLKEENKVSSRKVDESVIRAAFMQAKQMFESKELEDTSQLINLYLEKIIVYKEHVDIIVNVLPFFSDETDDTSYLFKKTISVLRREVYREVE